MIQHKNLSTAEVVAKLPKAPDLEIHVRKVDVDGIQVVEVRDYILSLKEYGRGYWVPANPATIDALIEALGQAKG